MLPDRVSNPGPLTYESGALPIALRGPATMRVVHLPKRTETSLITESDQSRANHQLLQLCMVRTADSDQAVQAVHSCKAGYVVIHNWSCEVIGIYPELGL